MNRSRSGSSPFGVLEQIDAIRHRQRVGLERQSEDVEAGVLDGSHIDDRLASAGKGPAVYINLSDMAKIWPAP